MTRRAIRATPLAPLLRRWWAWLHDGRMRAKDVLWIVRALDAARIPYALGGGWGIDALLGRQTRPHHDLDLVLLDFDRDEPRARRSLAALGFERIHHSQASSIWMPMRSLLDDDKGRSIDLVNIDETRLRSGLTGRPGGDAGESLDLSSVVVRTGRIGGRRVACLSSEVQALFHSRFELRAHHQADANLLAGLPGTGPEASP